MVQLLRPRQWVKNAFVLAPLLFSGEFLNPVSTRRSLLAMVLFCIASSAAYIVNDLLDIEADRRHPKKRLKRPLASGAVKVPHALMMLLFLYAVVASSYLLLPKAALVIWGYLALNIAYTFVLKHEPVVDIFTISIGFVLRVYAGAVALSVPVSGWMFVTTLCLALFLAAVKRRQELLQSGTEARNVLRKYTPGLVERYAEMAATGALVFYSLFVMSDRPEMMVTIPFVLFGLFRYWYIADALAEGESPTDTLLGDWQLLLTVAAWIGICLWSLWPS